MPLLRRRTLAALVPALQRQAASGSVTLCIDINLVRSGSVRQRGLLNAGRDLLVRTPTRLGASFLLRPTAARVSQARVGFSRSSRREPNDCLGLSSASYAKTAVTATTKIMDTGTLAAGTWLARFGEDMDVERAFSTVEIVMAVETRAAHALWDSSQPNFKPVSV